MTTLTKLRVQAQHLQVGDIVGSGELISNIIKASVSIPAGKVLVEFETNKDSKRIAALWGKCTMINIQREKK